MQEFFTKQKAEEGLKTPLFEPDGTPSEHWLRIVGIDSDIFKKADFLAKQKIVEISKLGTPEEQFEAQRELERGLVASLIIEWSFSIPCTHKNVVDFLTNAPQIETMVNRLSAQRSLFFKKDSKPLGNGPSSKSPSKRSRKAPKSS